MRVFSLRMEKSISGICSGIGNMYLRVKEFITFLEPLKRGTMQKKKYPRWILKMSTIAMERREEAFTDEAILLMQLKVNMK